MVTPSDMEKLNLLAKINKKGDENIVAAGISRSGDYLVYSDSVKNVLYKYSITSNEVKKINACDSFKNSPAKFLHFSAQSENLLILVTFVGKVLIYNIQNDKIEKEIFIRSQTFHKNEIYLNSDISSNGKILAITSSEKQLILVDLTTGEVSRSLPHPSSFVNQLKFLDSQTLVIIDEHNKFYIINTNEKQFHSYTKSNFEKVN